MIKAMIVDDEQSSIDLLQWLIQQYCPDITVVKTATRVPQAIPIIRTFQPDILFLDIRMPHQSGFDLLAATDQWSFEVVFTTAFNEYAIQAIRCSALDYLLKPVDANELIKAIERFKAKKIYSQGGQELFRNFVQNITAKNQETFKLALTSSGGIQYVKLSEVIRLQAERNYTRFYLNHNRTILSAKTLKDYEQILKTHRFLRVHKSHLVNQQFIEQYDREGWLLLEDGSRIEVARRKKDYLLQLFK